MSFDPYRKWMGIRTTVAGQPPHYYRLLGVEVYEDDPEVIESAADQRMTLLRTKQAGEHAVLAQQLLNEVAAARLCLLNPNRKAAYDAELRRQLAAQAADTTGQAQAERMDYGPSDEFAFSPSPRSGGMRQRQMNLAVVWGSVAAGVIAFVVIVAFVMWPKRQSPSEVADVEETAAAVEEETPPDDGPVEPLEDFDAEPWPRVRKASGATSKPQPATPVAHSEIRAVQPEASRRFPVEFHESNPGRWSLEGNELVQNSPDLRGGIYFGDPSWENYDYALDAKWTEGDGALGLRFHQSDRNCDEYCINGHHARQSIVSVANGATKLGERELSLKQNTWYRLEVHVRGKAVECFLNDEKVFAFQSPHDGRGRIGLRMWRANYRFRNILVKSPDGKVLLEGLPDLGGASAGSSAPATASTNSADGKSGQPNSSARFAVELDWLTPGKWTLEGDQLVHNGPDQTGIILFGDPAWERFDYSAEVKCSAGEGGFALLFHAQTSSNFDEYIFHGQRKQQEVLSVKDNRATPLVWRDLSLDLNAWHRFEVRVRGKAGTCVLNGEDVFTFESPHSAGRRTGLMAFRSNCRFRNILVKTPEGKVLLEGLPDLDGTLASSNAPSTASGTRPQNGNQSSPPADLIDGDDAPRKASEFAGRSKAGRIAAVKCGDATSGSEAAVQWGLRWLAKHQDSDGSWTLKIGNEATNTIDNRMGGTGLALLAFLGNGNTHKEGDYTKTVRSGLTYLIRNMKITSSGGDLRGGAGHQALYSHGICTTALCEAYALSKDNELKQPAQLAVDFIVNAQHAAGGWRYEPGQAGDVSVTGWQILALKSAKIANLKVPSKTIGKASAFLNAMQSDDGAQYGYDKPGAGPATNAIGLLSRIYTGWTPKQQALVKGVEILSKMGPQPNNIYYNFYATQVLHHWGGEEWRKWNVVMREQLVRGQSKEGDTAGSWSPIADQWGKGYGGRLYTTCMSIMTLEVYYRQLPIFIRQSTFGPQPIPTPVDPPEGNANSKPVAIDVLQLRPQSVASAGGIHWEQDHLRLEGEGALVFELPEKVYRFTAEAILNTPGKATFSVYVGNTLMFQNDQVTQGEPVKIDVLIEPGGNVLKLITRTNGSTGSVQAVWFEPRLTGWQDIGKESPLATRDPLNTFIATPVFLQAGEVDWTRQTLRMSLAGVSCVQYRIPEGAKRFLATNVVHGSGGARFTVKLDGEPAFRSDEISKVKRAQIDIPIKPGSKILELCTDPNAKDSGHGVWTNPHFDR